MTGFETDPLLAPVNFSSVHTRGAFFCISRNIRWGRVGVKMGQNENYTAFFALIEDFGCSFKLNFDGRGGKKW